MKPYTDKELARLDTHIKEHGSAQGFVRDKGRKKPSNEESQMQKAVVKWWRMNAQKFAENPRALIAIPNGGLRDVITAARMKEEGAIRGAPDLFLFVANNHYHGLGIEMKTAVGVVSKDQVAVHRMLAANNYKVIVCHSYESAKDAITSYLGS